MKSASVQRRKLTYLLGIMVLLGPIVALSYPASGRQNQGGASEGGYLSRLRSREGLGEATLGDVDPTSLTMNLVLLGLRGVAANVLWTQALEMQKVHNWSGLRTAVNSIILLQPHFIQVWSFQGWNLSYNVSIEFDSVDDRYYWVKEGVQFLQEGAKRNRTIPDLFHQIGVQLAHKIGGSDEREIFRDMFIKDEEFNPDLIDNYLAAKDWFTLSLKVAEEYGRNLIRSHPVIFHSSPGLALMHYAAALERDGVFDEKAKSAWKEAFDYWTGDFGRSPLAAPEGIQIQLEYLPEEYARLSDQQRFWAGRFQELVNYHYWKMRADMERTEEMLSARLNIYQGDKAYQRGDLRKARSFYETGMKLWDRVLKEKPQLLDAQEIIEDGTNVLLRYRDILTQFGEASRVEGLEEGKHLPDDFPMGMVWERFQQRLRESRLVQESQAERKRARRALREQERREQRKAEDR